MHILELKQINRLKKKGECWGNRQKLDIMILPYAPNWKKPRLGHQYSKKMEKRFV